MPVAFCMSDTLWDLFANVESRNIIAFVKDINFYHCM